MDTVKFIIEDYIDEENGFRFPTINIYINGKNLIDLVEQTEREFRGLHETPSSTSYVGLHPGYFRDFLDEFLGLQKRPYSLLLTCTCLEELCNCITGKIIIDGETATWSEIKSPWLRSKTPNAQMTDEEALEVGWHPIDYSHLGPFVFEREQYMDALNKLGKNGTF